MQGIIQNQGIDFKKILRKEGLSLRFYKKFDRNSVNRLYANQNKEITNDSLPI